MCTTNTPSLRELTETPAGERIHVLRRASAPRCERGRDRKLAEALLRSGDLTFSSKPNASPLRYRKHKGQMVCRTSQRRVIEPLLDLGPVHQDGERVREEQLARARLEAPPVVLDDRNAVLKRAKGRSSGMKRLLLFFSTAGSFR